MNAETKVEPDPLQKLREEFPPHQISKLPKESRKQIDERKTDKSKMLWKCGVCGGMHHKDAVHLDYVGHAALTDRLLDSDLHWSWEPVAFDELGLPAFDRNGGLWIKLTVCGVTRLGYGSADGKSGGDAVKEIIGDAMRNAAMRFGAALDLWHKGDLHAGEKVNPETGEISDGPKEYTFPEGPAKNITTLKTMTRALWREIEGCGDESELEPLLGTDENKKLIAQLQAVEHPEHSKIWNGDGADNPGVVGLIQRKRRMFAMQADTNPLMAG